MEKKCNFCGNKNHSQKNVQYIYKHDDKMLVVNNVPCEECNFCGERFFQANDIKKIERDFYDIYEQGKKMKNSIMVPVEDFAEVA